MQAPAHVLLRRMLEDVSSGRLTPEEALDRLQGSYIPAAEPSTATTQAVENLGFAQIDHAREQRTGFPEVIYGSGKTPSQIAEIALRVHKRSRVVLITRTNSEAYEAVLKLVPTAEFDADSGLIWADTRENSKQVTGLTVVSAGTSDLPVANEAVITATLMGCEVQQITDVGVAGLHRLINNLDELRRAKVLVVVAGMEGALPSVVAGLVSAPVIAVPTSVGYGASFEGLAALLAMMNSCASGVSVVNIDGGFAAGFQAALITKAIASGGAS